MILVTSEIVEYRVVVRLSCEDSAAMPAHTIKRRMSDFLRVPQEIAAFSVKIPFTNRD
jgi:hypothetical protein